ncbi:hypothetical protein [Enterovirga rhinocerotis]|uniref:hypothetical protein n=1 Tax=Enterovirga rhinocerotis TaxID=1339210 RepID=UPI00105F8DEE|nr:hypothetical protein [Enterovirga rhinocerotis]
MTTNKSMAMAALWITIGPACYALIFLYFGKAARKRLGGGYPDLWYKLISGYYSSDKEIGPFVRAANLVAIVMMVALLAILSWVVG